MTPRTILVALLASALPLAGCRAAAPEPVRAAQDAQEARAACERAKQLSDRREFDAALVEIHRALELEPRNAWAHYHLGWMLGETAGCRPAIESYTRAIELYEADLARDPVLWKVHFNRGFCWQELGQHEHARADFALVIEHSTNREWRRRALECRAQSSFALGLVDEGRRDQDEAERMRAEDAGGTR